VRIEETRDGSHTLFSEAAGQFYHNPNGAVEESKHVFFEHGGVTRAFIRNEPIHIFEMGFGTGLNLLLLDDALTEHPDHTAPISFTSVEAYPISEETARSLNYGRFLSHPDRMEALAACFAALKPGWNEVSWPGRIEVRVWVGDAGGDARADLRVRPRADTRADRQAETQADTRADTLVGPYTHFFHDPFSIEASPDLWSEAMFTWLRSLATPDALLSTYGAASKARAMMAAGGWFVARAPGALGKREMTLAAPTEDRLAGYSRVDEERLVRRLRNGEFESRSSAG
jgi:tRNA U34 5-methylaminomethyl-2-thiouridine-forming methyltransferase MnmC